MPLVKSKTAPLFVKEDLIISHLPLPKFTRNQINALTVYSNEAKGNRGPDYTVHSTILPSNPPVEISITESSFVRWSWVDFINEFRKRNPTDPATAWLTANANELNIALCYWRAVNSLEKAEINRLQANLSMCDVIAYATTGKCLNEQEVQRIVSEYGYDSEESHGYR